MVGQLFFVKRKDVSNHYAVLTPAVGLIENGPNLFLLSPGDCAEICNDGINWFVV
jgi:hypothetical protein